MRRTGQALIVVVIIFALIMSVFAISISTSMRSQAFEGTEIYQREQALYLAQMGINQMIYNINDGTTYANGQSIAGTSPDIGTYKATYVTPDNSGYGGIAYIKGEGAVGQFTRRIFVSLQGSGSSEAFKYCLYTSTGGKDDGTSRLSNLIYHLFLYNVEGGVLPEPDMSEYEANADHTINNPPSNLVELDNSYSNKVIYIHLDSNETLTVDFSKISKKTIVISLITDAKNVIVQGLKGKDWSNDKKPNIDYPLIVHTNTGSFEIKDSGNLDGFAYTKGYFIFDPSFTNIFGEIMEGNPQGYLNEAVITYTYNYFTIPPPFFSIPSNTTILPGSFREEY